ncbi:MAG: metallophosphoesterase [Nanoarchaeota archaeon]|nr:metallophosphoesterase [Nanoarchaeota archaeon]
MLILAVSDLDSLEGDYGQFWQLLEKAIEPDIFLLAGDMYIGDAPQNYKIILEHFEKLGWKCPIIACFGNREFEQKYEEIKKICGCRVNFLNDKSAALTVKGKTVGIVGSKGCLDQPTFWQLKNIPQIRKSYKERAEKIRQLLAQLKTDVKILLTHYAPTYQTLKGENPNIYGGLGCRQMEEILVKTKTTFAVHGHAHSGSPLGFAGSVPIFNVALLVNRGLTMIDTDKLPAPRKKGLDRFL